jgi:hypothetical protein
MTGRRQLTLVAALALLLAIGTTGTAQAAKRKVPFGFFGASVPHQIYDPALVSDAAVDQQAALMARSGVESARVTFAWEDIESVEGQFNLIRLDRLVSSAARHGISVTINMTGTPFWATDQPNGHWWALPPKDPSSYAELMRQLVLRYGPKGTLWAQNRSLPHVPVRRWQIWNEQSAPWHWETRPWGPSYTKFLKPTYKAIHALDPGAKVIAGSLVAAGANYAPWDAVKELYRAGAKRYFDVVAVHPFTNNPHSVTQTVDQTVEIVRRVRAQMRRHGDGRKPIILTEMTWPASAGKIPKSALLGLETTTTGQRKRLQGAYRRLAELHRQLGVTEAYWYSWSSEYDRDAPPSVMSFRYVGLVRSSGGSFSRMPLLKTYATLAAKYEGCHKTSDARHCHR